jgi:hypothetical protein
MENRNAESAADVSTVPRVAQGNLLRALASCEPTQLLKSASAPMQNHFLRANRIKQRPRGQPISYSAINKLVCLVLSKQLFSSRWPRFLARCMPRRSMTSSSLRLLFVRSQLHIEAIHLAAVAARADANPLASFSELQREFPGSSVARADCCSLHQRADIGHRSRHLGPLLPATSSGTPA